MKLKYFENRGDGKFELFLHGIVGLDIDGTEIAKEIKAINQTGAIEIIEHINSIGGSVIQGFSIVSANLISKAKVITVCEGVADSIAALILATGDERKILEYGSVMIHNVILGKESLNNIEDENDRKQAKIMNDSLTNILLNKCKIKRDELKSMMDEETRFNADDALKYGIVDSIVKIGKGKKKIELTENLSRKEFMNICKIDNEQGDNKKIKKMKTVIEFLNLNAEASESAVLAAIKNIQNKALKADSLQNEVTSLKQENESLKREKIDLEVQEFINKGLFDSSKKEDLVNMALKDINSLDILKQIKPGYTNVSDRLNSVPSRKKDEGEKSEKELAAEYQNLAENDPLALEDMQRFEPERFTNMFNAWQNL